MTLPTDEQILITREFDAPRELVYRAWTTPELVRRWWHASRGEMTVVRDRPARRRHAGATRWSPSGGFEVAFHGEYREIVPDERIVSTEVFEGVPGRRHGARHRRRSTERDGRTTLDDARAARQPRSDRDVHIESGMEDGMQDALDLLEQVAERRCALRRTGP